MSAEAGFGLIEVLVSALLVVIISLAVLGSMDSASRASGNSKAKAAAANLAQEDQERLRTMPPADLVALGSKSRVALVSQGDPNVAAVPFTVLSDANYVLNPGSNPGCTSDRRDEYLRIVSTVSWPAMKGVRPVRVESLVAPSLEAVSPGQGSAVLKVTRADGSTPVTGLGVNLTGPSAGMEPTGAEGCAFFADYPVGAYAFGFTRTGWVDPNGDASVSLPISIASQQVASLDALYDEAGQLSVTRFRTRAPAGASAADFASARAAQLTLSNPGITRNGGVRQFATTAATDAGASTDAASAAGLFPFTSPYSVYSSESCGQPLTGGLLNSVNGSGGTTKLTVARNGLYPDRWVFEPALNPTVRFKSVAVAGAQVFVKSTNPACPSPLETQTTLGSPTNRVGTLPERGFPFSGDTYAYSICAEYEDPNGGTDKWRTSGPVIKRNDQYDGVSWFLEITSSAKGRCQ